jgi:hypothetical protein
MDASMPKRPATRKAAPLPTISQADLRLALRDAVTRLGKPTSPTELRKALPKPHQRPLPEIARLLAGLAREGALFAVKDGKTLRYTDRDPSSIVALAVREALRDGPLGKKQLDARVKRAAPGLSELYPAVLAAEIARGTVCKHPEVGKYGIRYGLLPPDPVPYVAGAIRQIKAAAKKLSPSGVTKAAIFAVIGRALGLERVEQALERVEQEPDPRADEDLVQGALRELASREPPGALLSVRALRAMVALDKPRFDGAVLRLSRARKVILHHHDFPTSLPEVERAGLVQDAHGVHYVGVALRGDGVTA